MTDDSKALKAAARAICKARYGHLRGYPGRESFYEAEARAAIAACDAQREADGVVMVPVEPTARMVVAGANERENGDMELHARKWRAMIAARPIVER